MWFRSSCSVACSYSQCWRWLPLFVSLVAWMPCPDIESVVLICLLFALRGHVTSMTQHPGALWRVERHKSWASSEAHEVRRRLSFAVGSCSATTVFFQELQDSSVWAAVIPPFGCGLFGNCGPVDPHVSCFSSGQVALGEQKACFLSQHGSI